MSQSGRDPISNEYLHKFDPVAQKYGAALKDAPVLCWSCQPLFWFGLSDIKKNNVLFFNLHSKKTIASVLKFMEKTQHGWVILDESRFSRIYEKGYKKTKMKSRPPTKNIQFEDRVFKYVDNINGFYLYQW